MATDKEISYHYDKNIDFYADNWSVAFDDMVHFRILIEKAREFVEKSNDPKAISWCLEHDKIINIEEKS